MVSEQLVIQLGDLELVSLFPVHDPGAALALWVYQHRIPGRPGHHDSILDTQIISGQTLQHQYQYHKAKLQDNIRRHSYELQVSYTALAMLSLTRQWQQWQYHVQTHALSTQHCLRAWDTAAQVLRDIDACCVQATDDYDYSSIGSEKQAQAWLGQ